MKKIHATWEKRNMGIDCWEIEVESKDTVEEIENELAQYEKDYTVVKVPVNMFEVYKLLMQKGYFFVETLVHDSHDLEMPLMDELQKRIYQDMNFVVMQEEHIQRLKSEIDKGMFSTDRIIIDSEFSSEQAHNRYKCWIEQELENGAIAYEMQYKGKPIGFYVLKRDGEDGYMLLFAGVYQNYANLGLSLYYSAIENTIKDQKKFLSSSVSMNNKKSFAIHMHIGFVIDKTYYVFVKHNTR